MIVPQTWLHGSVDPTTGDRLDSGCFRIVLLNREAQSSVAPLQAVRTGNLPDFLWLLTTGVTPPTDLLVPGYRLLFSCFFVDEKN
jgi:hypothetical protein